MMRGIRRLVIALIVVLSSFIIGTLGFSIIEGYSVWDALYMTVITISTVGFREVQPLSDNGKIFTTLFIILNVSILFYAISVIATYIFEGELQKVYRNVLIGREVKKMKNHVIVCGYGRNGIKAAEELQRSGMKFIVIERSVEKINDHPANYQFIEGDATMDDTLIKAGIERAEGIITTLPSDADNVFITLTAKELNPEIEVIARASEHKTDTKLKRAGADHIVMPDMLGGLHMAQLITKPYVIEFLDLLNGVGGTEQHFILEEFTFDALKEDFKNKSIKEMDIRNETGAQVIALKDRKKGFIFSPNPNTDISEGTILIVLGTQECVDRFRAFYAA